VFDFRVNIYDGYEIYKISMRYDVIDAFFVVRFV
jgi:hypothetical protein